MVIWSDKFVEIDKVYPECAVMEDEYEDENMKRIGEDPYLSKLSRVQ